ncbi:hypothetical protein HanIR_Chr09g0417541 [Helianthus annuus]|nr:hypothetical protein HanIR_Chr09g0417541 [Helianthus annuus]
MSIYTKRLCFFFYEDGSGYIELDELEQVLYEPVTQTCVRVLNESMKQRS